MLTLYLQVLQRIGREKICLGNCLDADLAFRRQKTAARDGGVIRPALTRARDKQACKVVAFSPNVSSAEYNQDSRCCTLKDCPHVAPLATRRKHFVRERTVPRKQFGSYSGMP